MAEGSITCPLCRGLFKLTVAMSSTIEGPQKTKELVHQ